MRSKKIPIAAILSLAVLSVSPARAVLVTWTGSGSEFWTNSANWFGFSEPGVADTAEFSVDSPFVIRTGINLSANRTVASFQVDGNQFALGAYSFTRINGAVLTVSGSTLLGLTTTTTSSTTLNGFLLNTNSLSVRGQMTAAITGSSNVTTAGAMNLNNSGVLNLNGGSLNLAANTSHNLNDSSVMNVNGGTLNLGANATLNANANSTLNFSSGYNVTNNTLLRAQGGGDIVNSSFIDVGNGGTGFLTVNNTGSTITAQSSTSDWGRNAGANAVVDVFTGGTLSVAALRVGTVDAQSSLNVSGGTMNINNTLEAGGGTASRSVQLTVQNSGTMNVTGAATFNNQADVNLVLGTLDFNNSATFNAGSRLDISGGTLDTTNQTLTFNGGTLTQSVSGALSSGSALRVQAGGTATFSNFFDIGNGNSAALTVTGAGSTLTASGLSDWGSGSSGGAVVSIDSGGVAILGGLRIGNNNGSANVTVATGGQLRPNVLTVGGGSTARTVNLTINGGTVTTLDPNASNTFNDKAVLNLQAGTFDPKGQVTFFAGSTANWSGGSFLMGSGKTLTLQGGVINRTITAAGGLSPGATLIINSAGRFESVGSYSIGEFGAGTATVTGTGSRLNVTGNLTLGQSAGASAGNLTIGADGRLNVGDTATTNNVGTFSFIEDASVNPTDGGILTVFAGSTLTNTVNSGLSIGRGVGRRGSVIVSGAGATVNDNATFLGFQGAGTLTVNAGGKYIANSADFATSGGTATVTVDGAGSQLWSKGDLTLGSASFGGSSTVTTTAGGAVIVGDNAQGFAADRMVIGDNNPPAANAGGKLTISSGSSITHHSRSLIAPFLNTFGSVLVNGANSRWRTDADLIMSNSGGTADLRVEAGGSVSVGIGLVSGATGLGTSTLTVTGANSSIAVTNLLEVARDGTAALSINAAGLVTAADIGLGTGTTGVGTVNVSDAGSLLRSTNNLSLKNGSTLTTTNGGGLRIGDQAGAFLPDRMDISDSSPIGSGQGGNLTISGGSVLNHHSFILLGGIANSNGEVSVSGAGSRLISGLQLFVGNSGKGLITLSDGGKLTCPSFGINVGTGSKIVINAGGVFEHTIADLPGTRAYLSIGYAGGAWTGNGITSTTAQTDSRLGIGYAINAGTVTAKLTLKGDTDLNSTVNFDDLLTLAQNYNGTGKFWFEGDFNYDANVNFDDLLSLAQNYNQTLSVSQMSDLGSSFSSDWALATSMVPEPTIASTLLLAVPAFRRRRSNAE